MILLIFLAYRANETWLLVVLPPEARHDILGSWAITILWTTIFLTAIWFRQNWARYVFCILAGIFLFLSAVSAWQTMQAGATLAALVTYPVFRAVFIGMALHLVAICLILYFPPIRALTRHR